MTKRPISLRKFSDFPPADFPVSPTTEGFAADIALDEPGVERHDKLSRSSATPRVKKVRIVAKLKTRVEKSASVAAPASDPVPRKTAAAKRRSKSYADGTNT